MYQHLENIIHATRFSPKAGKWIVSNPSTNKIAEIDFISLQMHYRPAQGTGFRKPTAVKGVITYREGANTNIAISLAAKKSIHI